MLHHRQATVNDTVFSWLVSNAEVLMCFQEFFLILIAHS